jgi:hypothetical protein
MGILKLRNHIPISAPARREPCNGKESDMRVSLGFEPAWFHKRCGVEFLEDWHQDPYYRYETLRRMKEELVKRFPQVEYWDVSRRDDLATVSGCYGAYLIPHVFGISLGYAPDRWPVLKEKSKLSIRDIERLDHETILQGPAVEDLSHQMNIIESEWGKIQGYLNWQGILNNALHLRGQDIFLDLYDRPAFVHQVFSLICDVMIRLAKLVQERQRRSGFYINQMSVSNCVVNMISPDQYIEFVFPYDKRIAQNFERFGVHTCNWDVTPYIDVLKNLPKVGYLDMGIESDMRKVKEIFPEARRAVIYSPITFREATVEKIRQDIEHVYLELSPCDVVMADISWDTPDQRVHELLEICQELESRVA